MNIITVRLVVQYIPLVVLTTLMLHYGKEAVVPTVKIIVVLILKCHTSIESFLPTNMKVLKSEYAPMKGILKKLS